VRPLTSLSEILRRPSFRALGLGLLTFLVLTALSFFQLGQTLENQALNLAYRLRPLSPPPPELLIVGIDEPSFQELGHPWPWPRSLHARLIQRLADAGARLIVFDVLFADASTPAEDALLAAAIRQAGNVILPQTLAITEDPLFSRQVLIQPLEKFRREARTVALSMVTPDGDGVVRRFQLRLGGLETLPAAVVKNLRPEWHPPPGLGGLIHYAGPPRHLDTVSYYQVLDQDRPLPAARLQGRIVLVGRMLQASITPQAQADSFYTPFFGGSGRLMAGVEVQGNIIHSLLSGRWGRELPRAALFLLYLVVTLLVSQLLVRLSPLPGLGAAMALILLIFGASFLLFWQGDLWVPPVLLSGGVVSAYAANILGRYFLEAREKSWLRQAFGRYLSPDLVASLINHPDRLQLGGEEVEVTVLFADLAGFSRVSEEMTPPALINLLNDYFTPMTRIILDQDGTLDKYMGDSLMALWGAPLPLPDHALRACRAALEMQAAMHRLQQDWQARGLPPLGIRMGLHAGPVVAGNVGSREHFNYTVLGDAVNLAARLEGVNRHYGTEILVSEDLCRQTGGAFLLRELDQVLVKGRARPVTVYELLGPRPAAGEPPWVAAFAAGRAAYLERRWDLAAAHFQEVLSRKVDDGPAKLFLQRCRGYLEQPPPSDWQGVFILESK
jgi:adenylate cyclase